MGFSVALGVLGAVSLGCSSTGPRDAKAVSTSAGPHAHNLGVHNHARGKMLLASDGTFNALLTAHLSSKDGPSR